MKIAIIGGTGPEGSGLGFRWAASGHSVIIGSRQAEKGEAVAAELLAERPDFDISGTDNLTAVSQADVAILSVPYAAQKRTLEGLKEALSGKLLITVVAPTGEKKSQVLRLDSGMSAAEEAQEQLGDATRVVAAFQNIGAHHLRNLNYKMDCDVLICGQKAVDKNVAMQLAQDAGMRGVNAGSLVNSGVVEGLTSLLIFVNIKYKVSDAGIRITGIE